MTERPTYDDDIAGTLRDDPSTPPPDLDARIRAAAREALRETGAPGVPPTHRRWWVPAGAAVAATVLLAVLVTERASPPVPEPVPAPHVDALEEYAAARPPGAPAATRVAQRLHTLAADGGRRCEEGARVLTAAGLVLCIAEGYLQVHDISAEACRDALRLERGAGEISATPANDGVDVLVDGRLRWRVRCDPAAWVVTPMTPTTVPVPAAGDLLD
jgi:hypothetical protein